MGAKHEIFDFASWQSLGERFNTLAADAIPVKHQPLEYLTGWQHLCDRPHATVTDAIVTDVQLF
jgi:hypothetical protein